jgi:hypothetical protein
VTDLLGKLGNLADMGGDALLTVLATTIDAIGKGTDFTGEQIERLGQLQQQLADVARSVRDANEPPG